jgi:hypothetical protein
MRYIEPVVVRAAPKKWIFMREKKTRPTRKVERNHRWFTAPICR